MFQNMNFYDFLVKGGPVFMLIILFSIISVATIIERLAAFIRISFNSRKFFADLKYRLSKGNISDARELCRENRTVIGEVYLKVLEKKGKAKADIEETLQVEAAKISLYLEKKLIILATAGSVTPFVGLFGTVLGIISAFKSISLAEAFTPSLVTNGIAEALVNTAAGLFVAIPAVIAYNFFNNRIQLFMEEIEYESHEIIEILKG